MMRVFESTFALAMIILALPILVFASVGLFLGGTRPVFIVCERTAQGRSVRLLTFNMQSNSFGLLLRQLSPDTLPSLLWIVYGGLRLTDLYHSFGWNE